LTLIVGPRRVMYCGGNLGGIAPAMQAVRALFFVMPFLFGIGFIAPLTAEVMARVHVAAPLGLTPIGTGLIFGGLWGLYATVKGAWL
jgi:hypothetical protein